MSRKITSIPFKVGDKIQYEFSNNLPELTKKYEHKPLGGLSWVYRNCESEIVTTYRTVTVIESTNKSRFVVVQDEEGNIGTFVHKNYLGSNIYTPSDNPEDTNNLPMGNGVYRISFWGVKPEKSN